MEGFSNANSDKKAAGPKDHTKLTQHEIDEIKRETEAMKLRFPD